MIGPNVRRGIEDPRQAFRVVRALFRGRLYLWWYRMRGVRLQAGPNFRVFGKLSVRGPGRVIFGRDVKILGTVTPWTYSRDAVIEIGPGCRVHGTRFGCQQRIQVGAYTILADARIMDTNFHSVHANRHDPLAPVKVAPVVIGENVWIAANTGILPGTVIGKNSVVGFGAVCSGEFPENVIIAGNPARVVRPLPGTTDVRLPLNSVRVGVSPSPEPRTRVRETSPD